MEKQRVYCVFEGAGARGLGHVGAYRSLSKHSIEISGLAGTSAGAILAALACAGYDAEEIFSDKTGANILDRLDLDPDNLDAGQIKQPAKTPAKLFGDDAWFRLRLIRFLLARIWMLKVVGFTVLAIAVIGLWLFPQPALALLLATLLIATGAAIFFMRGVVSLDNVKTGLDQLLSVKHHGSRRGRPVTFKDLAEAGRLPLKIVAANITRQELTVFSAETSPDVAVSDAVCASIAIPGVFKPRRIDGNWFMDGGLVSNLPAWTFDDERSTDRDALTAAIEISVGGVKRPPQLAWTIGSAIRTMIFGSGILNKRGVDRLTSERLVVDLGLLDFDIGRTRAVEIVQKTETFCDGSLIARMIELPRSINDTCDAVSLKCHEFIEAAFAAAASPDRQFTTRIAIAIPIGPRNRTVRLEFSSGYADLSDERICLPLERSLIGDAWRQNETLYVSKSDEEVWNRSLSAPQDRWLRKLIWRDLSWVLCVPLEIDARTKVVVTLDSDVELDFDQDVQQELLDTLEALILKEFQFLRTVERELLNGR
ncbi:MULTISPECIES: patatin-like phospholipase family protein [Rhizobium]|uniref:Patatin-like phospholipase n=2 Tax=Rhizobium TaxID=379 RepID=N6UXT2_9HYPH|nr:MULTISPECIES: patatin-like phospholipase family protein [Rhizobium]ENN83697.1 patatin-like phospholipase [Rhizobium freirei PRF 81]MDK4741748.1 patatin-like phospholipase family protein [Rhizobium sp. CNPSo 3464]